MFDFLKSKAAIAVTLVLLAQAGLLYSAIRPETVPDSPPLSKLPRQMGNWEYIQDYDVDQETQDVLKADDLLLRGYADLAIGRAATLFVAAFRSQRNGKAPHSPKNCLPGSGWTQLSSDLLPVQVDSEAQPIVVNRYIVQHEDERSLVMYWYQSRDRVVASEYKAKFWVMADAIRLNRTDTALVRVVAPMRDASDVENATNAAVSFVQAFFAPLRQVLPE